MLTSEQSTTLQDVRVYEVVSTWLSGAIALLGAIAIGCSVSSCSCDLHSNIVTDVNSPINRGGIAFGVICLLVSVWLNKRRAEYKADIKYLQEQEGLQ